MSTDVAFIIKDTKPAEGYPDTVGIIASIDNSNFSLEKLIEEVKDIFHYGDLLDRFGLPDEVDIKHGIEEVNGVLVGALYLTGFTKTELSLVTDELLKKSSWSGTQATPQAVALYIKELGNTSSLTGPWKGFYNF